MCINRFRANLLSNIHFGHLPATISQFTGTQVNPAAYMYMAKYLGAYIAQAPSQRLAVPATSAE